MNIYFRKINPQKCMKSLNVMLSVDEQIMNFEFKMGMALFQKF